MRARFFSHGIRVELELGDGDAIGAMRGQVGIEHGFNVVFRQCVFPQMRRP
jgi:hypothetical protein